MGRQRPYQAVTATDWSNVRRRVQTAPLQPTQWGEGRVANTATAGWTACLHSQPLTHTPTTACTLPTTAQLQWQYTTTTRSNQSLLKLTHFSSLHSLAHSLTHSPQSSSTYHPHPPTSPSTCDVPFSVRLAGRAGPVCLRVRPADPCSVLILLCRIGSLLFLSVVRCVFIRLFFFFLFYAWFA